MSVILEQESTQESTAEAAAEPTHRLPSVEEASMAIQTPALALRPPERSTDESLEQSLQEWRARRAVLARFLKGELKEEIDYGAIHIGKDCADYKKTRTCKHKGHWSKDVLFKPGSEKVLGFLQLRPVFERDADTWEMLGKPAGILCFRCLLLSPSGEIVGEGRGARDVQKQDYGDINKAVKQCQKSSQIDAILRVGALSDVFIQDLDDGVTTDGTKTTGDTIPHQTTEVELRDAIKDILKTKFAFVGTSTSAYVTKVRELTDRDLLPENFGLILESLREYTPVENTR